MGPNARPGTHGSGVQAKAAGYRLVVGAYMHDEPLPEAVAGHSFVAIEDPSGERHAFGFSPAHYGSYEPQRDMGRLKMGVEGVVHDDAGAFEKPGVRTKAYPISAQQARAALTKVSEYESGRHRYSADRQQCSTFALDVMRAARVQVLESGAAPRPRVMYEALGGQVTQPKRAVVRVPVVQRAEKTNEFAQYDDKWWLKAQRLAGPYATLEAWETWGKVSRFQGFAANQRAALIAANKARNGGKLKSDADNDPIQNLTETVGQDDSVEVDHVIASSRGGSNHWWNARLISRRLNNALERVVDAKNKK